MGRVEEWKYGFAGVGVNLDIKNGNFNQNGGTGVASYENSWMFAKSDDDKFGIGISGHASGLSTDYMISMEGSNIRLSTGAYIFKAGGSIDIVLGKKKIKIGGEVIAVENRCRFFIR